MSTLTKTPWHCKLLHSHVDPGYALFWEDTSKAGIYTRRLDYQGCFTEADARILAAAPDLLVALKQIKVLAPAGSMMREDAEVAIAKAIGAQPC